MSIRAAGRSVPGAFGIGVVYTESKYHLSSGVVMAVILIKDLPENLDLDRQAMGTIFGGARSGVRQTIGSRVALDSTRVVDFPASRIAAAPHPATKATTRGKGRK
jgi:hypothetical protein